MELMCISIPTLTFYWNQEIEEVGLVVLTLVPYLLTRGL